MRPEVAAALNSCATCPDLTPIGTKSLRLNQFCLSTHEQSTEERSFRSKPRWTDSEPDSDYHRPGLNK